MEDELALLRTINVSGGADWDCYVTILHFQQCGRCAPDSARYIMNQTLGYVFDPRGVAIRPCRSGCAFIYKRCKDTLMLNGEAMIPAGVSEGDFCALSPVVDTPEEPCFNAAKDRLTGMSRLLAIVLVVCMSTLWFL
jgi:hypothetical protein